MHCPVLCMRVISNKLLSLHFYQFYRLFLMRSMNYLFHYTNQTVIVNWLPRFKRKSQWELVVGLYWLIFVRSSFFAEHGEEHVAYKNCSEYQKQFLYTTCSPQVWAWNFMYWTCNSMNNLSSYCGLVDAKIRSSDKDLLL